MLDIRFNPPPKPEEIVQNNENSSLKKRWRNRWLLALILLAVMVSGTAVFVFWPSLSGLFSFNNSSTYYALFLTNGQVYFGKIEKQNDEQIILKEVFYFQSNETADSKSKFELVKLGNELHGPTDELYVNKEQVLFYEELRADSKVVEAIKNYK